MINNNALNNAICNTSQLAYPCKQLQRGFALIASLFFLVLMTLLALAMYNGLTLDEKMGGNLREKSRAIESAQAAIRAGEFALQQFAGKTIAKDVNPTSVNNVGSFATIVTTCPKGNATGDYKASIVTICLNKIESVDTTYATGITYQPTVIGVSASGGIGTYAAYPTYYIQYLGQDAADTTGRGLSPFYLITARGTGGNGTAVAVLQSVFSLGPVVRDGGN